MVADPHATTPRDFLRWRKRQSDIAAQAARFDFMGDARPVDVVRERARGDHYLRFVTAFMPKARR